MGDPEESCEGARELLVRHSILYRPFGTLSTEGQPLDLPCLHEFDKWVADDAHRGKAVSKPSVSALHQALARCSDGGVAA